MTRVFSCTVDRRNFGDLFSAEGLSSLNLRSSEKKKDLLARRPDGASVVAMWLQDDPRRTLNVPDLLVCQDDTEADWAAWITTIGARLRPFSASTRLLSHSSFETALNEETNPPLSFLMWPAAGLVLGEILAASGLPDKALESISASACASTLTFAMFRAAVVYPGFDQWNSLAKAWEFAREVTKQKARPIETAAIARVCATVLEAAGQGYVNTLQSVDAKMQIATRELIQDPQQPPFSLKSIPGFSIAHERMIGPREDRVVAFSAFADELTKSAYADHDLGSLALGYLVSRVAPGTIQHATLLGTVGATFATSYLWYGFFAALLGTDAAKSRSNSKPNFDLPPSARRIVRDLTRAEPILGPPACDVSVLELGALARTGGDPLSGLITSTQSTVTIELLPAVSVVVNMPMRSAADTAARGQRERELLLSDLGDQISRLVHTYRRLLGNDPPLYPEHDQASLFPDKKRKR